MIKFIKFSDDAVIPARATSSSAGFDLTNMSEKKQLNPGDRQLFCTGIGMAMDSDLVGIIKARSSFAKNFGVDVLAGVIDADYRGEIKVILINHGQKPIIIRKYERIAQLVVTPYLGAAFEVDNLDDTERSSGGFGSTGK